jgi:hypothetical protein
LARRVAGIARVWQRLRRAYVTACARQDIRALGLYVPEGVWFCPPCRLAFLDGWDIARHRFAHSS